MTGLMVHDSVENTVVLMIIDITWSQKLSTDNTGFYLSWKTHLYKIHPQQESTDMTGLLFQESGAVLLKRLALTWSTHMPFFKTHDSDAVLLMRHVVTCSPERISRYDLFEGSRKCGEHSCTEETCCHLNRRNNLEVCFLWRYMIVRRTHFYWREFIPRKNLQIYLVWRFKTVWSTQFYWSDFLSLDSKKKSPGIHWLNVEYHENWRDFISPKNSPDMTGFKVHGSEVVLLKRDTFTWSPEGISR